MKREILLTGAELADLLAMRAAQKRFYATFGADQAEEHHMALLDAKRLEKRVDALLERLEGEQATLPLFEEVPA